LYITHTGQLLSQMWGTGSHRYQY